MLKGKEEHDLIIELRSVMRY